MGQRYSVLIDAVFQREGQRPMASGNFVDYSVQLWSSRTPAFLLTVHVLADTRLIATISQPKRCSLVEQFLAARADDASRDAVDIASRVEFDRHVLDAEELRKIDPLIRKLRRLKVGASVQPGVREAGSSQYIVKISAMGEQLQFSLHGPSKHPLVGWAEAMQNAVTPMLEASPK